MKERWRRYFPVEVDGVDMLERWIRIDLLVVGFTFLLCLLQLINMRILARDYKMSGMPVEYVQIGVSSVLACRMFPMILFAVYLLWKMIDFYGMHWIRSKSNYTMRRLSDPWELHRRCGLAPLIGVLLVWSQVLLLALIMLLLYYVIIPEEFHAGDWNLIYLLKEWPRWYWFLN